MAVDGLNAALAAVTAHGLPGAEVSAPRTPLDDDSWTLFLANVAPQGLSGLLAAAVSDGTIPATEAQRAEVHDRHLSSMVTVLLLERLLLESVEALAAAGVETRVLKGSAVAHLDYADPALRPFRDVDLLVRGDDLPRTVDVLRQAGIVARANELRRGFASRFGKGITLYTHEAYEIDVHRTFAHGAFGTRVPLGDVWDGQQELRLGGQVLHALRAEERLLHAAFHCVLGGPAPKAISVRDVAEMALYGDYSQDRLRSTARAWRAEAVLAVAVRHAWRSLRIADITAVSSWAARYEPTLADRRLLRMYQSDASYAAHAMSSLRAVPGVRGKAAFIQSLALPDQRFLEMHEMTRVQWLRRGVARVGQALRDPERGP